MTIEERVKLAEEKHHNGYNCAQAVLCSYSDKLGIDEETLFRLSEGCRTDFADIQNKKECGGNRQWQNHYLRNWAANTKGKGII